MANGARVALWVIKLNDMSAIVRSKYTPGEFERMIEDSSPCSMRKAPIRPGDGDRAASVHHGPGASHCRAGALGFIDGFPGVWKATGSEIARHYMACEELA